MKQKLCSALAGYSLIGIASGMFVYSGLGADCFNTLVKGFAPLLGLAVGTASYLVQMVMLAAVLLLGGRKYAGPGTVFGSLIVTLIVNLFGSALAPAMAAMPLAGKVTTVLAWFDRQRYHADPHQRTAPALPVPYRARRL